MFIGISGYNHESAVALVNQRGELVDYCKEESLSRIKGDKSFPCRSLERIITKNKLNRKSEISKVIFYERPISAFLHPIHTAAAYIPESLNLLAHQFRNFKISSAYCFLDLAKTFPGLENKLIYSDHHLSHTLTSLAYSKSSRNLCSIVVDGFGDRSTASISHVHNTTQITELWSCKYPISLGLFYSSITDFLGFAINEGEYKVMGLAAFGNPKNKYKQLLSKLISWDKDSSALHLDMNYFSYHISTINSYSQKLIEILGQPRNPFQPLTLNDKLFQKYADIARATQDITVEILSNIFEYAYKLTGCRDYLFSGGVAMNSASLSTIAALPFIDNLVIPPSPGDSGAAIGAAFYGYLKSNYSNGKIVKPSLYPVSYSVVDQEVQVSKIIKESFEIIDVNRSTALKSIAKLINNSEIIGILLENSETGPRALGNRSLICNGKDHDAVNRLNTVIKNRSPFRPTAPAMRESTARKYYSLNPALLDSYKSMSATCKCLPGSEAESFPVTHVDGTARLQTVEKETFLDDLLEQLIPFNIEILANSSLNMSGDPTCFDLFDGLMVCERTPLRYIFTDIGLLRKKN